MSLSLLFCPFDTSDYPFYGALEVKYDTWVIRGIVCHVSHISLQKTYGQIGNRKIYNSPMYFYENVPGLLW